MISKTKFFEQKRPFVFVNMAMTADGKIATANRAVSSFGSKRDLQHLYELRATADAIICGAHTIKEARAIFGNGGKKFGKLRIKNGLAEFNLRVIVSGHGSINPAAPIFKKKFSPVIVLTTARAPEKKLMRLRAVADEVKIFGQREINFPDALKWLRKKWKVKRLLCEGGGELNDAFFRNRLVNELHLTICPKIAGGRVAPTIADGIGFQKLADATRWQLKSARQCKDELFTVFSLRKK
jgi:2,5-diamino-6-(ribosylamino)-4(3H)-pyrimidinone 5'-phosphate reductase